MASINLVTYSPTTHSYTKTRDGVDQGTSDGGNTIDENFSTSMGYSGSKGDGGLTVIVISEHTFPTSYNLTSVKYRLYAGASASGSYTRSYNALMYVEYYDGSWHDVPGSRYSGGGGDGSWSYDTGNITYTGSLTNVSKIRAYTYGYGLATGGEGSASAFGYIYEVEAFGEQYKDVGFSYKKSTTLYRIACEALLPTHKFRTSKNSTTYGIPLVDISDPSASPIRVYDGSAIKAFILYT